MENISKKTVAQIVSEDIKTAHVFKKYGIDFCCGGGISVEKACEKSKVDLNALEKELVAATGPVDRQHDYKSWPLGFLADYIVNTHHAYVEESFKILDQYIEKVVKVHAHHHVPLLEIQKLYYTVKDELQHHMLKEERILFPYIRALELARQQNTRPPEAHFGTVKNPIHMMNNEHENAGNILAAIDGLTNHYKAPDWACNTFKALYAKLEEFEQDLHLHVHLENNILFPKAIQLEQELNFQSSEV